MLKPVSLLASASTLSPAATAEFSGDKAIGIGSDELELGSHQQRRAQFSSYGLTGRSAAQAQGLIVFAPAGGHELDGALQAAHGDFFQLLLGESQDKAESLQLL